MLVESHGSHSDAEKLGAKATFVKLKQAFRLHLCLEKFNQHDFHRKAQECV